MLNESHDGFPNRIRSLIVENDARFLRSASLMLSHMNYRVATCDTQASAVRLLSGSLKCADVVFIDALRAATCGFDFRGIVESHLCIPVIYFLSRDYGVPGDMAEALQRTVRAATYIIMKPLNVDAISGLWGFIQRAKFMLRHGENTAWSEWSRSNRALHLPAIVQALLPSSSTIHENQQGEEDDGREHFRVVRARRGQPRRDQGDRHDDASSGCGRGRGRVAGRQPTRRLEQMNVTQGQESNDLFPSYQQRAQQNPRGIQAMDVQNQQHSGWSQFMQPVLQMLNVPHNPMISANAAGPSSSNATAFAGTSNVSAPALLPPVHRQQQPVAPYDFGKMVAPPAAAVPTMAAIRGHQPPQFAVNQQQHQDMFAPWRQGDWMERRRETRPTMLSFQQPPAADPFTSMAAGGMTFGASPADATDAAVAHLQSSSSVGAQPEPADSFDDDVFRQTMMEMDDKFSRSNYGNCSAEALMALPATDELAAMVSGKRSNYNAGSFMVTDVDGGNSASFMAPQEDLAMPTGNQVELGAPADIYGSLLGSPGPSAMFNGNGDMAEMFSSHQYDKNAMFSLDALWDFDKDVPMHPEGQRQVATADSTANTNGGLDIMSNGGASGGLGPNWNLGAGDNGLDIMEELLRKDNAMVSSSRKT